MSFRMRITQDTCVVPVLFDDADSIFDDALRKCGFTWRNLLLAGNRAGEFPVVVSRTYGPATEAYDQR
ncbi:hypothetical protein D9M68_732880 [compost metagenome]